MLTEREEFSKQDILSQYKRHNGRKHNSGTVLRIHVQGDREEENQRRDCKRQKIKNGQLIEKLKHEIKILREDLQGIENESVAATSNVLRKHPDLLLAFQGLEPKHIKEHMEHKVERERHILDKLTNSLADSENELLTKQVMYTEMVEQVQKEDLGALDCRRELQNRIQEFKTKQLAGKNIQSVYRKIINILKTEQSEFGLILDELKNDKNLQERCLIRAIQLGQLATEDTANLEKEYELRERDTHINMQMQMSDLRELRSMLSEVEKESQELIRSESFPNLKSLSADFHEEEDELVRQVQEASVQLRKVQDAILVPSFNDIFPRLSEQLRQNQRLVEEVNKSHETFAFMMNRRYVLHSIRVAVRSQGYDDTSFVSQLVDKWRSINEVKAELNKVMHQINGIARHIINIRSAFRRLFHVITTVPGFGDMADDEPTGLTISGEVLYILQRLKTATMELLSRIKGDVREEERERILASAIKRLIRFMASAPPKESEQDEAKIALELAMETTDPSVPSRAEIKLKSKKVFELATSNLFE